MIAPIYRLIPVLTGNSDVEASVTFNMAVNPRTHGEQFSTTSLFVYRYG